jgi:chromosome segregation ATPase
MENLEVAVKEALGKVEGLLGDLEATERGIKAIQEDLVRDTAALESQWTDVAGRLRELASGLDTEIGMVLEESRVTVDSCGQLAEVCERLDKDVGLEADAIEREQEALGDRLGSLELDLEQALEVSEQESASLLPRLESAQSELLGMLEALGSTIEGGLLGELSAFEAELGHLEDAVSQELLPGLGVTLAARLASFLDRADAAEHRVARAVEAAGVKIQAATRSALDAWTASHADVEHQLDGLGAALQSGLRDLGAFTDDQARHVSRERESTSAALREAQDSMEEALAAISDTEETLRRHGFLNG